MEPSVASPTVSSVVSSVAAATEPTAVPTAPAPSGTGADGDRPPVTSEPDVRSSRPSSRDDAAPAGGEAAGAFPLRIDPDSRHLVGSDGEPFLLLGDAAWSLIVELDEHDVDQYLTNRRHLGFNTVLVSLIEHHFSSDPPNNRAGIPPFETPGDFAAPNEPYFEHVDRVIERMADEGFVVLLAADYAGWDGGVEGWWQEMQSSSVEELRDYGRFIGSRYARFDNIIWVSGGDYAPDDKEPLAAVASGIAESDPDALQTAHLTRGGPAPRSYWSDASWLDLDNVYADGDVYESAVAAFQESAMPFFLIESTYENEHGVTTRELRTQAYQALLAGATGHVFGNNPIWHFGAGGVTDAPVTWQQALDGPGSQSMAGVARFMTSIDWWDLRPDIDGRLVIDGVGSERTRVAAAVAVDSSWAAVYVPTEQPVTVDLSTITGSEAHLTWFDPSTGAAVWEADVAGDGPIGLEWPGSNATGDGDWVVMVEGA